MEKESFNESFYVWALALHKEVCKLLSIRLLTWDEGEYTVCEIRTVFSLMVTSAAPCEPHPLLS